MNYILVNTNGKQLEPLNIVEIFAGRRLLGNTSVCLSVWWHVPHRHIEIDVRI